MVKKTSRLREGLEKIISGDLSSSSIIFEEVESRNSNNHLDYLLCMEEFLDDCHVYAFEGWDKAVIASLPKIGKYWFTCDLFVPQTTDFRAARRIRGKNSENKIFYKEDGDKYIVRLKILRRVLDSITEKNMAYAEKNANIGPYAKSSTDNDTPEESV